MMTETRIPMPTHPPDEMREVMAEALDLSRHYGEPPEDQAAAVYARAVRWVRENTLTPESEARLLGEEQP